MKNQNKIPQVYGYSVCIVATITFLITLAKLINSIIDVSYPDYHSWSDQQYTTFEKYKMNTLNAYGKDSNYIPTDEELKIMY
ncbi:MAG: hypothetical protein PF517_12810 [Salinivirgaceae bacterium]|jgi:hypothetical protein|nr:hypothetical protein [Salinivirgaceae bacterium]